MFDVRVTGNRGFAKTYLRSQRIAMYSTTTIVRDDRDPSTYGKPVQFTAIVARRVSGKGTPRGTVQFTVNGERVSQPILLDTKGQAIWRGMRLAPGTHKVAARYVPSSGSAFLPSTSSGELHVVAKD